MYIGSGQEFRPALYACDLESLAEGKALVSTRARESLFCGRRLALPVQMPSSLLRCVTLGTLLVSLNLSFLILLYLPHGHVRVQ